MIVSHATAKTVDGDNGDHAHNGTDKRKDNFGVEAAVQRHRRKDVFGCGVRFDEVEAVFPRPNFAQTAQHEASQRGDGASGELFEEPTDDTGERNQSQNSPNADKDNSDDVKIFDRP